MVRDYISREAAIETFEQAFDNNWEVSGTLDRIRAIPAADVAPVRHGRWEQVGSIIPLYECDQCHAITLGGNFCSNCGAIMDGGQDDAG